MLKYVLIKQKVTESDKKGKIMSEQHYCVVCGRKIEDPTKVGGRCPGCGEESFFVSDPSRWFRIRKSNGKNDFCFLNFAPRRIPSTWVEIWTDKNGYDKLVEVLSRDKRVTVIKNDTSYRSFEYTRDGCGGCEFSLNFIGYVDYLIDPFWDGDPFVEFEFVQKDDPKFEIYRQELTRIHTILD